MRTFCFIRDLTVENREHTKHLEQGQELLTSLQVIPDTCVPKLRSRAKEAGPTEGDTSQGPLLRVDFGEEGLRSTHGGI